MSLELGDIVAKLRERNTHNLGDREMEVLQLVARGWMTKQIAAHFGTSEKTVDSQRANLMSKLGAKTPAHMVWIACQRGLV